MDRILVKKNILISLIGRLLTIILGITIPRLFIGSYGSDANGLLSTISQVFTYLALIEAGIGAAAQNALYKPVKNDKKDEIGDLVRAASKSFRKSALIYAAGVIILAALLPLTIKTGVSPAEVSILVLLEGASGIISYCFISAPAALLNACGKTYVNNIIGFAVRIAGYIVKILFAVSGKSIVVMQLIYSLITALSACFYSMYFRKKYNWISTPRPAGKTRLKDRRSYVISEFCCAVFYATDMIVISVFIGTEAASVYSIYSIVFAAVTSIVEAVFMSLVYLLGHAYHMGIENYAKVHDSFNSVFIGMITSLMSVCCYLTIPFVKLYTKGVTDIDYIHPALPMMFCLLQIMIWGLYTSGQLTGIAGYAKQTSYVSLLEAIINVTLSVILVRSMGIEGAILATLIAVPVKIIWCTYVADKKVMKRSYRKFALVMGLNLAFFGAAALISKLFTLNINSYRQFILWGAILTAVFTSSCMGLNILANRECLKVLKELAFSKNETF